MSKTHELKIWPKWFDAVQDGTKTYEIRKDDRGFAVGDIVVLEEFRSGVGAYTGRKVERRIVYISRGDDGESIGLHDGYCVLGLVP
jgi:hypothetical protein